MFAPVGCSYHFYTVVSIDRHERLATGGAGGLSGLSAVLLRHAAVPCGLPGLQGALPDSLAAVRESEQARGENVCPASKQFYPAVSFCGF